MANIVTLLDDTLKLELPSLKFWSKINRQLQNFWTNLLFVSSRVIWNSFLEPKVLEYSNIQIFITSLLGTNNTYNAYNTNIQIQTIQQFPIAVVTLYDSECLQNANTRFQHDSYLVHMFVLFTWLFFVNKITSQYVLINMPVVLRRYSSKEVSSSQRKIVYSLVLSLHGCYNVRK